MQKNPKAPEEYSRRATRILSERRARRHGLGYERTPCCRTFGHTPRRASCRQGRLQSFQCAQVLRSGGSDRRHEPQTAPSESPNRPGPRRGPSRTSSFSGPIDESFRGALCFELRQLLLCLLQGSMLPIGVAFGNKSPCFSTVSPLKELSADVLQRGILLR